MLEVYDSEENEAVNQKHLKDGHCLNTKKICILKDCMNRTLYNYTTQYITIYLNTSISFNYFRLNLTYPEIVTSNINQTNITITPIINDSVICESIKKEKSIFVNKISEAISVLCKFSTNITANDHKFDLSSMTSNRITLKFDSNPNLNNYRLKVSICELKLFEYQMNDCGNPDKPLYSNVSTNGSLTQFDCIDGYEIHPSIPGGYRVKCDLNSEWNHKFPICKAKTYWYLPENKNMSGTNQTNTSVTNQINKSGNNENNALKNNYVLIGSVLLLCLITILIIIMIWCKHKYSKIKITGLSTS